ncbi:MAG TPA: type I restriction enzyme HsdR N-terminal domain-containing protein, partial [Phycisphaerales bacterium]|nr:type I restriction enzyme HsdR N-terminal domain-containing protein [Phycisphaerales bacterium]
MPLETAVTDVTVRLREGKYPNEQAISVGIVLRFLAELGWDSWDATSIWPEYQTGEGRADFAICHPPSKPAILIEVKQPGKAEEAVRQALEYAFHTGVPLVVLTDGQTWSFYLPAEQGSYDDRRVYKLDLFERTSAEAAVILRRYLERKQVESGQSLEMARTEYRNRNRRAQAHAAIPHVWEELVEKGEESLVELLAGAVESKTGVRPEEDDVAEFLVGLRANSPKSPTVSPVRPAAPAATMAPQLSKRN